MATSSDSKIPGFTRPHFIGFVEDLFFSTLERGFKNVRICCQFRQMRVDESRIRQEKVADSKVSGSLWMGPITTVFVDTRLSKAKHPQKRFQNLVQSCVLSTDRIEIHQSQPASMTVKEGLNVKLVAVIGGFRSDLLITRKTDGNFGNVSAGVLFSKVAYQGKRW